MLRCNLVRVCFGTCLFRVYFLRSLSFLCSRLCSRLSGVGILWSNHSVNGESHCQCHAPPEWYALRALRRVGGDGILSSLFLAVACWKCTNLLHRLVSCQRRQQPLGEVQKVRPQTNPISHNGLPRGSLPCVEWRCGCRTQNPSSHGIFQWPSHAWGEGVLLLSLNPLPLSTQTQRRSCRGCWFAPCVSMLIAARHRTSPLCSLSDRTSSDE